MKKNETYFEIYEELLEEGISFKKIIREIILVFLFVIFLIYEDGFVFDKLSHYLSQYTSFNTSLLWSVVICICGSLAMGLLVYYLPVKTPIITQEEIISRVKEKMREIDKDEKIKLEELEEIIT